jgi:hypothetical protein
MLKVPASLVSSIAEACLLDSDTPKVLLLHQHSKVLKPSFIRQILVGEIPNPERNVLYLTDLNILATTALSQQFSRDNLKIVPVGATLVGYSYDTCVIDIDIRTLMKEACEKYIIDTIQVRSSSFNSKCLLLVDYEENDSSIGLLESYYKHFVIIEL